MKQCLICKQEFDAFNQEDLFCLDHSTEQEFDYVITRTDSDECDSIGKQEIKTFKLHNDALQYVKTDYVAVGDYPCIEYSYDEHDKSIEMRWNGECISIKWRAVNPDKTKLRCENEDCEFFNKNESEGGRFLLVVKFSEIHDFRISESGEVGDDLTIDMNENLHPEFTVREIRCNHCDEDTTIPENWKTNFNLNREKMEHLNPELIKPLNPIGELIDKIYAITDDTTSELNMIIELKDSGKVSKKANIKLQKLVNKINNENISTEDIIAELEEIKSEESK